MNMLGIITILTCKCELVQRIVNKCAYGALNV